MNTIAGRVVLKESGVGIPDLLVVIYDLDPGTKVEEPPIPNAASPNTGPRQGEGDRLGSVLTGPDGSFQLTYENAEFSVRNDQERRPDLHLSVLAPEEPGADAESRVLYVSTNVRQNAGLIESYLIRLGTEQLQKLGITTPSGVASEPEPASSVIGRRTANKARRSLLVDAAFTEAKQQTEARRARFAAFHQVVKPALFGELSGISVAMPDRDRFVAPGQSVSATMAAAMRKTIREVINSDNSARRPRANGFINLTEGEVNELRAQADADGRVDVGAVAAIGERNGQTSTTTFVQAEDRLPLCRPKTAHSDCAQALLDPADPAAPEAPVVVGDSVSEIANADIPRYLARLMEPLTAPEEKLLTGLMPVATQASVRGTIEALSFPPSPEPVYYASPTFVRSGIPYQFVGTLDDFEALQSLIPTRFQVYVIKDSSGRTVYVGITGGETRALDALDRLRQHLYTKKGEFVGDAAWIEVRGRNLDERVARGLEDHLIDARNPHWNNRERDPQSYVRKYGQKPPIEEVRAAQNANLRFRIDLLPATPPTR